MRMRSVPVIEIRPYLSLSENAQALSAILLKFEGGIYRGG